MSHRPRSSINSHYFTTDPVSVRDTGFRQGGSKFFTKGAENSPKPVLDSGSLNSLLPSNSSQSLSSEFSGPGHVAPENPTSKARMSDSDPLLGQQVHETNNSFPSEMSTFSNMGNMSSITGFSNSTRLSNLSSFAASNNSRSLPSASESDVFTVDGADGPLQVDRALLRETLQQLKDHSQTLVNQLTPEKTESFKSVLEALRMLYNNQSAYDIVLGDIRREFSETSIVKPGTVAAFFVGCFTNDKFPGPPGCSPNCVASVFPAVGTPGYSHCDDLVLIYNDGIFSSLNEKRSVHAYIYVGDAQFTGFSTVNITQLKDAGVENASIVFGNTDGTFREVTSVLSLDQLPKYTGVKLEVNTQPAASADANVSNNSMTGGLIALALIFIAIVVLLYIIYRDRV